MPVEDRPISANDAKRLFAGLQSAPALVLAVSGGPDSMALMWLAARWRRALSQGPQLIAATIDHGLRAEAAAEARQVKQAARALDIPHRTLRWTGAKPKAGLPAAAREARYHLLAQLARNRGATHILTAHTRDDQAETLLMRMLRGSGIAGLAAMARTTERHGLILARPLLEVPKSQLLATLKKAGLSFAEDPTNRDPHFTRPRIRALIAILAEEGGDARNLARLASRLARANAAVERMVDGAERYLALRDCETPAARSDVHGCAAGTAARFNAKAFAGLPEEVRLRLLLRAINRYGDQGPAELGKVEALLAVLDQSVSGGRQPRLKQTLAGALISLVDGGIKIALAPPRRCTKAP
jgi:tRNA(Ile)-lysidine synthase